MVESDEQTAILMVTAAAPLYEYESESERQWSQPVKSRTRRMVFMRGCRFIIHLVIKLPSGVEINSLIDDLRLFSWEASETLLYYSQILKDSNNKSNIIKNNNRKDPVTLADLKPSNYFDWQ